MTHQLPRGARRTRQFGETIFSEITALALSHGAVNLGQGFPDFAPPGFVLDAARRAATGEDQQYSRGPGNPHLVRALAEDLGPSFGRELDPMTEITVTVGATEGLFAAIQALVEPGDEVILLEPFYDSYPADVVLAGAEARYVPLRTDADGAWRLDLQELRDACSPRTRLLVLNTPQNPTGKVFSAEELAGIADLCQERNLLVLCDEVYERIVFDGKAHLRLASLPGMWERTVTLGSAGKTFSVTGWKIGWAVAPPRLSLALVRIHQWIPFSVATPLQRAVAQVLVEARRSGYYDELTAMYQRKRDRLVQILRDAGLRPLVPEGTYFVIAEFDGDFADDADFCRHLTTERGVAAIPPGAFYSEEHRHLAARLARFCFCKEDETLVVAAARLAPLETCDLRLET